MLRRRAGYRHHHRAGLAAALALAALSGCGGEDDPDEFAPVGGPLSKAEFLAEADRICFATEARIEAAADELATAPGEPDPAQVERIALGIAVPALEGEVRAIRALQAPAGDEREVEAILTATERGIAAVESDPRALLDRVPPPLVRAQELAEAYGSEQCGFRVAER